jgi:hypothetical protein
LKPNRIFEHSSPEEQCAKKPAMKSHEMPTMRRNPSLKAFPLKGAYEGGCFRDPNENPRIRPKMFKNDG